MKLGEFDLFDVSTWQMPDFLSSDSGTQETGNWFSEQLSTSDGSIPVAVATDSRIYSAIQEFPAGTFDSVPQSGSASPDWWNAWGKDVFKGTAEVAKTVIGQYSVQKLPTGQYTFVPKASAPVPTIQLGQGGGAQGSALIQSGLPDDMKNVFLPLALAGGILLIAILGRDGK